MNEFKINDSEFGIDAKKSSFGLTPDGGELFVEICGDREAFEILESAPQSPWDWALYPPKFYVHGFPFKRTGDGKCVAHISLEDLEEYEAALYMMAHHDVSDVTVELVPGQYVLIRGKVQLFQEEESFSIHWSTKN